MKRVWVLLTVCMLITLSGCNFLSNSSPESNQGVSETQANAGPLSTPTLTSVPTSTLVLPPLREGYPPTPALYTRTGLTDSEFNALWVGGYLSYYHILADKKLGPNPVPVTFGFGGNDAIYIISADGKSITTLASYTTFRMDGTIRYEEFWRIIAFKSYDSIRVIRSFVGELPNLSGSAAVDVRRQTSDLAGRKGVIRNMLLVLDSAGAVETSIDVIQVMGGMVIKAEPVVKDIVESSGTNIPKEIENLLIYGLING